MNKEMFISSSPHETKVAVCEDGQLVEVYFERDTDVGLVGGIYKGRVNRVLPGMQSAFVDIGLERDAFLYVSDFSLQDREDYEGILSDSQARGATLEVETPSPPGPAGEQPLEGQAVAAPGEEASLNEAAAAPLDREAPESRGPGASAPAPLEPPNSGVSSETDSAVKTSDEDRGFHRRPHRGRRHRRHGRGGVEERRSGHRSEHQASPKPSEPASNFEILPGETLAKYGHLDKGDASAPQTVPGPAAEEVAPPQGPVGTNASEPATSSSEVPASAELQTEDPASAAHEEPASLTSAPSEPSFRGPEPVEEAPSEAASPAAPAAPESEAVSASPSELTTGTSGDPHAQESNADLQTLAAPAPEAENAPQEQTESSPEPSERSYTLHEPHGHPRFAPRRGRRGRRRPSRGGRRHNGRETVRAGNQQGLQISELLKEGQEIIVQIAKEPLGTKGARITSHIALPGRYVVYMPTISHIGVSRKIASEQERLRLRNIVVEHKGSLPGGFIVRTAGEGRSEEQIKADLKFLTTLWNEIRTKAEHAKAPALLYRDLDLAQRLMRDLLTPDFKSIWLDNETDYEHVVEFANRLQPSMVGAAKLHTRATPLFEEHGIQSEIEKALRPKVWLKSGGYIVINQTEALVAIDVNTGKYVGKTNRLEDTIVKTNIDAVNEIVRQIRLRDLGGIIVIDFIDMDERRNRNKVVQALEEALRRDRAPTKVLSFNDFGLVAVTRKRVKQSLERTLCDPCDYCNGSGWIKSVSTVCHEILAEARKMAREIEGKVFTLRVNPEVAHALKSKDGTLIAEIESLTHKDVVIKSDPTTHQERFEIF